MITPNPDNLEDASASLYARRAIILSEIRTHLHSQSDTDSLTLTNQLEEVGEWAEADLQNDTDIAILGKEFTELRDLDAALLRIKSGAYGICTDCGESIPPERMHAQITAQRCLPCQTIEDKRRGIDRAASL